ncbi:MAG: hypothetical protein E3J37_02435 [Anaerolineales bacterium]|nr:MAG: hypothetical protein E3J37_02435 [Anaerolineales bacterium]
MKRKNMTDTKIRCSLCLTFMLLLATLLVACQPDTVAPGVTQTQPQGGTELQVQVTEAAGAEPNLQEIQQAWQIGPHADTFVVTSEGENSVCARCHAPAVFIPSMDDVSEACLTCKFEIAPPPPLVPAEEWTNIECNVCHFVSKKGEVDPEYAWLLFLQIQEYEEVASSTELCGKCHAEADFNIPGYKPIFVGGAHADYLCTECHDAHVIAASCGSAGCHDEIQEIPGHDEDHEAVTCGACHDAGDLEVGPDEDLRVWLTFLPANAEGVSVPFTSHNTQLEANCERCHYPDNPWDLSEDVSTP